MVVPNQYARAALRRRLHGLNTERRPRPAVEPGLRLALQQEFEPDIRRLEQPPRSGPHPVVGPRARRASRGAGDRTGAVTMPGIIVLGMHRSGTSAVTRIVNLLGAGLGPDDDLLTEFDNPAGHWESIRLNRCNDRILAAFGRSWDFPPWLDPGWEHSPRATRLLPDMAETFTGVYSSDPWVWKDPRTCLTLPLWRRVLDPEPMRRARAA